MEECVDVFGGHGMVEAEPPVEEGEERAGEGAGGGAKFGGGQIDAGLDEALLDGAGEAADPEFADIGAFAGGVDGGIEVAHCGQVSEEFLDGEEARGGCSAAGEKSAHQFEEVFDIAEEEVVFIPVVGVEGGAGDTGAVEHLLHSDGVEGLFAHERDEGVPEGVAGAKGAAVGLRDGAGWGGGCGFG